MESLLKVFTTFTSQFSIQTICQFVSLPEIVHTLFIQNSICNFLGFVCTEIYFFWVVADGGGALGEVHLGFWVAIG